MTANPLRVTVHIELEIDPDAWAAEYDVDPDEGVSADVRRYYASFTAGDMMAGTFGPIATIREAAVGPLRKVHEWRVTFGGQYRNEPHPRFSDAHPDGWVSILAETEEQARACAFDHLGPSWAFIYPAEQVGRDGHPLGELARWTAP